MPMISNAKRRGDLHVIFAVHVPHTIDPQARRLAEELDKAIPEDAYKGEGGGLFDRLRGRHRG